MSNRSLSTETKRPPVAANRSVLSPASHFPLVSRRQTLSAATKVLIQPKLKIGAPNDKYEQEADQVADQVMRMPELRYSAPAANPPTANPGNSGGGIIRRTCAACSKEYQAAEQERHPFVSSNLYPKCRIQAKPMIGTITPLIQRQETEEEEEETPIQAKAFGQTRAVTPDITNGIQSLHGGGQPLSDSSRHFFEPRFNRDFSKVRIHTDNRASDLASSINARAFTLGRDVVFGSGQYQPHSYTGQRLLAHELTHVAQQQTLSPCNPIRQGNIARDVLPRNGAYPQPGDADTQQEHHLQHNERNHVHLSARSNPQIVQREENPATAPDTGRSTASVTQPEQWATDIDLGRFGRYSRGRADARLNRREALEHAQRGDGGDAPPCQLDLFLKLRFNFHLGPSPYRHGPMSPITQSGPSWPAARAARWKRDYMRVAQEMWRTRRPLERTGNCPNEPCTRAVGQLRIIDVETMTDSTGQQVPGNRMSNQPHFTVNVYEFRPWAGQLESRVGGSQSTLYAEDVLPRGTPRPRNLDERPVPPGMTRPPRVFEERYRWMPGSAGHETGHMLGRPHVNCAPDVDNPNEERCYGETNAQRANVMGRGSEFRREDHAPFIAAMRATTNCEWRVPSGGWPWWAYLLLAVPVLGWITLGILAATGII